MRSVKFPIIEVGEVFKEYELDKVQPLTRPITEMDALTLNYLLSKLVQEVAVFQRSIPSENTLYQIVCGIRRFMVEKNPATEFNPLDSSDKSCVNWRYWRGSRSLFLIRFAIFRRILDAEMKDGTRAGVCLKAKKEMYCKL